MGRPARPTVRPARARRAPRPRPGARRGPRAGGGVRGVPHRPPPGRGRPPAPPARHRARPRGRRPGRWPGARPPTGSRSATGWASPGCATPAVRAAGAAGATRTCAWRPRFTGWDADGGYAELAVVDERYAYRLPDGLRRRARRAPAVRRDHRLPGAEAGRAAARRPPRASTASGPRPTWPPRWRWPRGPRSTCMTRDRGRPAPGPRPGGGLGRAVRRGAARLARRRRAVRPGGHAGAPPPSRRSTGAARWRSPASTSATSRRSTTTATCSRSGRCAASPPTPGPTARSSWRLAARIGLRVTTTPYPLDRADGALRDLAADRVTGAAVLVPGARAGRLRARRSAKRRSGA